MQKIIHGEQIVYMISMPYHNGGVNAYLLENEYGLTLIDAGADSDENWERLLDTLKQAGRSIGDIDRVLITHHHEDHIGLLHRLLAERNIPVFAHPEAIPRMRFDPAYAEMRVEFFRNLYRDMGCGQLGEAEIAGLRRRQKEYARLQVDGDIRPAAPDALSAVAGLEPIESFGHSPDHVMLYDAREKVLFSGDHVLPGINSNAIVEPDLRGGRLKTLVTYYRSLKRCRNIDAELALPGHGEPFRNYRQTVDQRLAHIERKVRRLLSLFPDRPTTAFELAQKYYPTEYQRQFSLVMSSIIGALDFLEDQGLVASVRQNGVIRYSRNDAAAAEKTDIAAESRRRQTEP